jgi:hypothetical protein
MVKNEGLNRLYMHAQAPEHKFYAIQVPYFSVDNARVIYTKKLKYGKIRTCALYIRKRHEGSQIQ